MIRRSSIVQGIVVLVASFGAQAVEISDTATGDVILFPYITLLDGFQGLARIRNMSAQTSVVQIALHDEADGARLHALTVFVPANGQARLALSDGISPDGDVAYVTVDDVCILPEEVSEEQYSTFPIGVEAFSGWMEVYELGQAELDFAGEFEKTCQGAQGLVGQSLLPPSGELSVELHLIDVFGGINYSVDPTVLRDFGAESRIPDSSEDYPTLEDASPVAIIDGVSSQWATGAGAVSAVLSARSVRSSFSVEQVLNGTTDQVLTFPTRHLGFADGENPFIDNAVDGPGQQLGVSIYDERGVALPYPGSGAICTPRAPLEPDYPGPVVRSSQMVFHYQPDSALPSTYPEPAGVDQPISSCVGGGFSAVWAESVTEGQAMFDMGEFEQVSLDGVRVVGLPVLSISITQIANGLLTDEDGGLVVSNYSLTNTVEIDREVSP